MLSETAQQLLTAYVDGVLTARDVAGVERLIRESTEARALIWSLRENARRMKELPRHTLGADFAARVLAQLPGVTNGVPNGEPVEFQPIEPATVPVDDVEDIIVKPRRLRRGMPAWAVGGIAASVLGMGVFGGMLWLRNQFDEDSMRLPRESVQAPVVKVKSPIHDEAVDKLVAQVILGSGQRYGEARVEPIVVPKDAPIRFAFGDLQKQNSFDHLKWELTHANGGVNLDVTVKYNARSLNRIIESFNNHGIRLVVTPSAEASAAKKQPLLVYAENVNGDKLALALKELGEIDVQGQSKEPSTFAQIKVAPSSADDHKTVAQGLGIDPRQLKSPATPVPSVAPVGVVLPAQPVANPAQVSEIRGFLNGRGPVQIGTLQVFLRLQPVQ